MIKISKQKEHCTYEVIIGLCGFFVKQKTEFLEIKKRDK